ncbi:hypothetical protein Taro_017870 [Colocasia esculenta]|uniref:Uncharacterized protein n=1 Tax=Colocasia esculenta TaxID=4460 RepID=A0A843US88_COLES|nr:hypothetical protein [Colocasia esculenta]
MARLYTLLIMRKPRSIAVATLLITRKLRLAPPLRSVPIPILSRVEGEGAGDGDVGELHLCDIPYGRCRCAEEGVTTAQDTTAGAAARPRCGRRLLLLCDRRYCRRRRTSSVGASTVGRSSTASTSSCTAGFDPLDGSNIVDTNITIDNILGVWQGDKLTGVTGRDQDLAACIFADYGSSRLSGSDTLMVSANCTWNSSKKLNPCSPPPPRTPSQAFLSRRQRR